MKQITFFIFFLYGFAAQAEVQVFGPLFQKSETLQLELHYNIKKFQAEKESYKEVGIPAAISLNGHALQVEVLSRGKGSFGCQQPQLKINFKNADTAGTEFQGFKKIRLFTRGICMGNKTDTENDKAILANYLQYRLLELVTTYHFKTRLVEISYTDDSNTFAPYKQLAFFLEPDDHLESRAGLKDITPSYMTALAPELIAKVDSTSSSLATAFEFFIGNGDFGIPGGYNPFSKQKVPYLKNSKVYQTADGVVHPMIFDFDFSRLNYSGASICWASIEMTGFLGGRKQLSTSCVEDEILSAITNDLTTLPFQSEVIKNYSILLTAFDTWSRLYKDKMEILGSKYIQDSQMFIRSFKKAVEIQTIR